MKKQRRGFTLIELIIVMLLIVLMASLAAPSLSRFAKGSKVHQAAHTVMAAMWHARSEAQRYRTTVAVLYGPDRNAIPVQPVESAAYHLPPKGQVEIWTMKAQDGVGVTRSPYCPEGYSLTTNRWYPFRFPIINLTPQPITIPDGVRIVCGRLSGVTPLTATFTFDKYRKDSVGEWKKYVSRYCNNGSMAIDNSSEHAFYHVLVYDESTGEYVVIRAGEWKASTRPRIEKQPGSDNALKLTRIGTTPLARQADLPRLIDALPGDM